MRAVNAGPDCMTPTQWMEIHRGILSYYATYGRESPPADSQERQIWGAACNCKIFSAEVLFERLPAMFGLFIFSDVLACHPIDSNGDVDIYTPLVCISWSNDSRVFNTERDIHKQTFQVPLVGSVVQVKAF